jgi:hypothetical protein
VLLPTAFADENIFIAYRNPTIDYFSERYIKWHLPNHLLCSQTCCVDFWFIFMHEPDYLAEVLRDLGYPVAEMLEFEFDSLDSLQSMGWRVARQPSDIDLGSSARRRGYLAFEWVGARNYLRELSFGAVAGDVNRSRGQYFTSIDVAVRFRRTDGLTQIVLIEWKYTEKYRIGRSLRFSAKGTDRLDQIYRTSLEAPDCQVVLNGISPEALFFDPFDQMMRHQLLASAMERGWEMGASIVSYLHIAPRANSELLQRITSPDLQSRGGDIHEIWRSMVRDDRFQSVYTEDLLPIVIAHAPDNEWARYLNLRYGGLA